VSYSQNFSLRAVFGEEDSVLERFCAEIVKR